MQPLFLDIGPFRDTIIVAIINNEMGGLRLKPKGFVRKTKQREAILEVLKNTTSHPTADWVYQEVRKQMPQVSLGTIYRNLKVLSEHGEIQELCFGSAHSHFDANPDDHYHFVCEHCGAIEDLDLDVVTELDAKVEECGYRVKTHRLEFYGLCPECADKAQTGD